MDLRRLGQRAKELIEKRGGTESVKEDAAELQEIAKGEGSLGDKAKSAAKAIKEPGVADATKETGATEAPESPDAAQTGAAERERAREKVEAEQRGKHSEGA